MSPESCDATGVLVEAEAFADYGGWVLDSQFELEMGSPYLLAHGLGRPVADASTAVQIDDPGRYRVWVRARTGFLASPGPSTLAINGTGLKTEFGATAATGHRDQPARSTCPAATPRSACMT